MSADPMGSWKVISGVTVAYIYTSIAMLRSGDSPMALVWLGYSIANVGFIWKMLT